MDCVLYPVFHDAMTILLPCFRPRLQKPKKDTPSKMVHFDVSHIRTMSSSPDCSLVPLRTSRPEARMALKYTESWSSPHLMFKDRSIQWSFIYTEDRMVRTRTASALKGSGSQPMD